MPTARKKTVRELFAEMAKWPDSWKGVSEDVPLGERLVAEFAPFVEHLARSGLTPATVRRHMLNLWVLGGKIVRDASMYDETHRPAAEFLDKALGPYDGPLVSELSEAEQRSPDATCRKFHRFRQSLPPLR